MPFHLMNVINKLVSYDSFCAKITLAKHFFTMMINLDKMNMHDPISKCCNIFLHKLYNSEINKGFKWFEEKLIKIKWVPP